MRENFFLAVNILLAPKLFTFIKLDGLNITNTEYFNQKVSLDFFYTFAYFL